MKNKDSFLDIKIRRSTVGMFLAAGLIFVPTGSQIIRSYKETLKPPAAKLTVSSPPKDKWLSPNVITITDGGHCLVNIKIDELTPGALEVCDPPRMRAASNLTKMEPLFDAAAAAAQIEPKLLEIIYQHETAFGLVLTGQTSTHASGAEQMIDDVRGDSLQRIATHPDLYASFLLAYAPRTAQALQTAINQPIDVRVQKMEAALATTAVEKSPVDALLSALLINHLQNQLQQKIGHQPEGGLFLIAYVYGAKSAEKIYTALQSSPRRAISDVIPKKFLENNNIPVQLTVNDFCKIYSGQFSRYAAVINKFEITHEVADLATPIVMEARKVSAEEARSYKGKSSRHSKHNPETRLATQSPRPDHRVFHPSKPGKMALKHNYKHSYL